MSKILKVVGASWLQTKISSYILGILGVLAILALFVGQMERTQEDGNFSATVFYSEKAGYRIEYWGQSNDLADVQRGVARAYFRKDMDTTGWSILEIETDESYPDEIQAYAAGILEGALTWNHIHSFLENTIRAKCKDPKAMKQCEKLSDALDSSVRKWKNHAEELADVDPFWHHVYLHYNQIYGIYTGWKYGIERSQNEFETDKTDLFWLNSLAEAIEIQRKINISIEDPLENLPDISSAYVRIVNETTETGIKTKKLYVAQNAAGSYSSMNRILKHYKLNYHQTATKGSPLIPITSVDMSAYPGAVTSQDEFYILNGEGRKMAVTGTALRNYNNKLWSEVNIIEQVPLAPRVSAANHLSVNVSSWGHVIATNNSGTGCKQWLVVDFARFDRLHEPSEVDGDESDVVTETSVNDNVRHTVVHHQHHSSARASGLLWLVEQVPGLTHARDLSASFLHAGYWANYGLPHIKDIAKITNVPEMEDLYGDIFSMTESPKAVIFKRGYKNATSLESIIDLMRQNSLPRNVTEPCEGFLDCISKEDGYWSMLGVRGDVVSNNKEPYGVIDTKVVFGTVNITSLEFVAIAGPPFSAVDINSTKTLMNKGNLASVYTDKFDDRPTINSFEIGNLVKQEREKAEADVLKILNKNAVHPFEWSKSAFSEVPHESLPDRWAFSPYKLKWSW